MDSTTDHYVLAIRRRLFCALQFTLAALCFALTAVPAKTMHSAEMLKGEEAMAALRFLATHAASNLNAINSWKAEFQYSLVYSHGEKTAEIAKRQAQGVDLPTDGPLSQEDSGVLLLSYSSKLDAFSCIVKNNGPPIITDLRSGKRVNDEQIATFYQHAIVTPERFLYFMPEMSHVQSVANKVGDGTPTRMAFRDQLTETAGREWIDITSPRLLFSIDNAPFNIWLERFPNFYDKATPEVRKVYDESISIEKTSDQNNTNSYTMRWRTATWTKVIHFPQASGYLPARYTTYSSGGQISSDNVWRYVAYDNIFVPDFLTREIFASANSDSASKYSLRLVTSSLNAPIDESEFTVKAFSLRDGELFLDRVEGKLWVSKQGDLVDVASYNASLKWDPRWWVIAANVAVLSIVAAVFYRARRRRITG